MTDRKALDRPAAVTAAIIGVLLIAISVPFLATQDADAGGKTYTIAWSETAYKAVTATQAAAGVEQTLTFQIEETRVSNITLGITCTDNRGPGSLAPAAQVTWTLTFLDAEPVTGNACAIDERYSVIGHPDVGETKADSAESAISAIWNRYSAGNVSGEVKLSFTWTRGGTTGPLPVPPQGTSFSATLSLGSQMWTPTANEKSTEDLR